MHRQHTHAEVHETVRVNLEGRSCVHGREVGGCAWEVGGCAWEAGRCAWEVGGWGSHPLAPPLYIW
eukprot:350355-Chlamydomonas_euryale.AAC.3